MNIHVDEDMRYKYLEMFTTHHTHISAAYYTQLI